MSKMDLLFRFCKIGLRKSEILYSFLAKKMVVCCLVWFVAIPTLSDFSILIF